MGWPSRCGLWCWAGSLAVARGRWCLARRRSSWRRPCTSSDLWSWTLLRRGKSTTPLARPGTAPRQEPCRVVAVPSPARACAFLRRPLSTPSPLEREPSQASRPERSPSGGTGGVCYITLDLLKIVVWHVARCQFHNQQSGQSRTLSSTRQSVVSPPRVALGPHGAPPGQPLCSWSCTLQP